MTIDEACPAQLTAHSDHKARLHRLGAIPKPLPIFVPPPIIKRDILRVATPLPPTPIEPPPLNAHSVEAVIYHAAFYFGTTRTDLKSARRTATLAYRRMVAMFVARTLTIKSLPEIGRRFGGRDHTTVLHAVRKIENLIKRDASVAYDVAMIERIMEQ